MPSPSSSYSAGSFLPTPLLVSFAAGKFRFSTHYRVLAEVEPKQVATWLLGWCDQQEAEHIKRLAEIEASLRRSESLTTENLRPVAGLDLGIDL